MIKILICILFLTFNLANTYSQKLISGRYYDKDGYPLKGLNKPYLLVELFSASDKSKNIIVQHTYFDTDNTKLLGTYKNRYDRVLIGKKIEGYENGNYKSITYHDHNGNFIDTATYFYDNGNIKLIKVYDIASNNNINEKVKIIAFYDYDGNRLLKDGTGYVEIENEFFIEKGFFKNNNRDSIWIGSFRDLPYTFEETYQNGIFKVGITIDSLGNKYPYTQSEIFIEPKYDNGINNLKKSLANAYFNKENKNFTSQALKLSVDIDGSVKIISFLTEQFSKIQTEKIRHVLQSSQPWSPAILRGIKAKNSFKLQLAYQ